MTIWERLGLGRKGGGDDARAPLARYGAIGWIGGWVGGPSGEDAPLPYAAAIRAAYEGNAVAQRAVRIVAEGASGAPLAASEERAATLVGASSAGQSLVETVASHLLLHGNAFVQIVRGADGAPTELYALRPDRMEVVPDARGWPALYRYRVGGDSVDYPGESGDAKPQIVHIKSFHPDDDHYGLGCLGAASRAVAVHNAAAKWNRALLENGARPTGALVHDPGDGANLTADQFDRLKAEMAAAFEGAGNAGRPMLLDGGLSWQAMSLSPADMDFAGLKESAAREIALAFGVPPMLLGLPGDNSYANYREANRALWRLTLLPLCAKIHGALAQALSAWWPGLSLGVDLDRLPALSEDRERLWTQVSAADFLTREEKRELLGLASVSA